MEAGDRTKGKRISGQERLARWYWTPATIFLVGVLSMALLIWTDQVNQAQRTHFAFTNALMDLRIRVATSHLWLEEAIAGEGGDEIDRAWSDLREATRLSEVLLNGGESEHGLILQPLTDPKLRRRAEDIRWLLSEFGMIARERRQRPEFTGVGSVLENRTDAIFDDLQRRADELERIVERNEAADHAKSRRLIFGIFLTWSSIVVVATIGLLRRERRRRHAEEALERARDELEMRVAERTRELRSLNDQLSLEVIEHMKAEEALRETEKQLRQLSASLLTAQETERRRISRGLHDGLGHSLVLIKLRLGLIGEELGEDQSAAKADCEDLSQFTDQVIDDVRRLARDLRPAALEDLGLSAALRCLVNNYIRNYGANVVSSLVDVDHLFSPDAEIAIYRTVQEALTNVAKHAEAERVSLIAERHEGRISFVVEDDGKGFDVKEAVTKDASGTGFGLATMDERARMLGGSLSVWSEQGKGTRITLGISVPNGVSVPNGGSL